MSAINNRLNPIPVPLPPPPAGQPLVARHATPPLLRRNVNEAQRPIAMPNPHARRNLNAGLQAAAAAREILFGRDGG